ncbi:sulfate ABC transporter substrate-binding protein [Caulobacter sp. 17J65-9]|uniref:sulfate ABC transporter substrate-binding protein n=1 Tax=Caulobacter sp. 17J65-9 TaxID=2709382 RepID=UPI0013C8A1DB|nr:sulfate ABC transporter substrate-binding protein [Caulobacter sp. 17J65-9]NEX92975.1 sulfate ABC transporter substrate-binding protein [Caulobacter sp. 17J65-9]
MPRRPTKRDFIGAAGALALTPLVACRQGGATGGATQILNVSYDPTRELYKDFNARFIDAWRKAGGREVAVNMSHGGSGKQARAVIDGLEADLVTLALAYDIDALASRGLLAADWQAKLPSNSCPYTSTIVFLVRKGNPRGIHDWQDLAVPGVSVITPNPKTSGGARWNFLAAWAWAQKHPDVAGTPEQFVAKLYKNVPVLDTGARGATTTFVQRGIGDVLLAWENEAHLSMEELGHGKVDVVLPSISIKAEPPVAVVDKIVDRRGTREVSEAYVKALYDDWAQDLVAKHHYRPSDPTVAAKYASQFPALQMATIADFGGWAEAQKKFFADGGVFDRIYQGDRK